MTCYYDYLLQACICLEEGSFASAVVSKTFSLSLEEVKEVAMIAQALFSI